MVLKIRAGYIALVGIFFVVPFAPSSSAQAPGNAGDAVEQARQRTFDVQPQLQQQNLPLGVNLSNLPVSTSGDLDLGIQMIMKRQEAEPNYRFFADIAGFYTSNVALTPVNALGDSYLFADLGFTYQRRLTDELSWEATISQGFFSYSQLTQFNFQDFNIGSGLTYQLKKLWDISVFGRYNFERFTQGDIGTDFFRNNTITVGAQKSFTFTGNHYVYFGYSSIFGWADPYYAERDEHGLFAGAHYNITQQFYGELYYRIAAFDYAVGRTDLNQMVVATVAYVFNQNVKLSASYSFVSDRSNHSVYSYDAGTTGGGLALQVRF